MTPWTAPRPSATSATRAGSRSRLRVHAALLARQEGGGGRVRHGRHARLEDACGDRVPVGRLAHLGHGGGQLALVAAARAALERRVREAVGLQVAEQHALVGVELDGLEPRAQHRPCVARPEVAALRLVLGHDPLDHPHHRGRVGWRVVVVAAERPHGEGHRRVRPLGRRALVAEGADAARADVREELLRRRRLRRLGPGAPDVHPRVVVRAADPDPAMGVDVDGGRQVELAGTGAVADLPDREQLGEPAPVARGQRRLDGVERVSERARDLVLVQVGGHRLDVAGVGLQPLVVAGRDAEAEHVHGLRLAAEARGQLLGDEHVGPVGDLEDAGDRVVVGDRHEVHAAALGQGMDLLGRCGALGQPQLALDPQLRHLGGR